MADVSIIIALKMEESGKEYLKANYSKFNFATPSFKLPSISFRNSSNEIEMATNARGKKLPKEATFEVYVLFKTIGEDYYNNYPMYSHWTCLLKSVANGEFYYSELQTDNGDKEGKIEIRFGKYNFLKPPIYYWQGGYTCRKFEEIRNYAKTSNYNGQDYKLFSRNCQHYVLDLLKFLETKGTMTAEEILNKPVFSQKDLDEIPDNMVAQSKDDIHMCDIK